jgi:hypothetical protein
LQLQLQLQLQLLLPLPVLCLSFRSAAEESAVAVALAVTSPFVIPQRSEGICRRSCRCSCRCLSFSLSFRSAAEESAVAVVLAVACPFVCHSAAQRRNPLFAFAVPLLLFRLLPLQKNQLPVISTGATDSLIVCCAVERSAFAFVHAFASR